MKLGQSRHWVLAGAVAAVFGPSAWGQVTFSIDETKGLETISPYIYGINGNLTASQNLTFSRAGGNRWTAYNYTNNLSNAGSDYYYENDTYLGGGNVPAGAVLPTVTAAQASNAGVLLTVPMNGWVAGQVTAPLPPNTVPTAPPSEPDFVPEYPTQAQDPAPAANHVYENGFVQIIKNAWAANPTGILAFDLDNEPDLWDSTHAEVHPSQTTYAELISDSIEYATMIKQVDPQALVYGPVSYGWEGFETLQNAPDSAADGNFLAYYLKQMNAASSAAGVRLLDALDLHWYPEATGGGDRITDNGTSAAEIAARLQAPRSLWDPTYVENSWITQDTLNNTGIDLIPREQAIIAANYPGTKLSFSEYDYGAGTSISGGVAEADVLGIFGKYGVYSANQWPTGAGNGSDDYVAGAFAMFRNYDGKDSTFGDTEVEAVNTDTVNSSVYASIDSKNPAHLTMVVINKESNTYTAAINIADAGYYTSAQVYTLTAASPNPQFAGNINLSNPTSFSYGMPGFSATTISLWLAPQPWTATGGGAWTTAANWAGGQTVPQHAGQVINFAGAITANSTIALSGNETVGGITFSNGFSYAIQAANGAKLTLDDGINAVAITDSAGSHTLAVPLLLNSNAAVSVTRAGDRLVLGSVSGTNGLSISGAGAVALSGSTLSSVNALTIAAGSTLDLTSSGIAINYGAAAADPIGAIKSELVSGYNGGAWNGAGIGSSSAAGSNGAFSVGYLDGNVDTGGAAKANQVLVAYTLAGDATLTGSVGFADLVTVAENFGATGKDWAAGNFTYDPNGSVGFADLVLVAENFGRSGAIAGQGQLNGISPLWQAQATAVVPEPGALGIFGVMGWLLVRCRR